jgi:NAD(P) transhydrogenase subunit alpha
MPQHASFLYARNVAALCEHLVRDGRLALDMSEEITRAITVTHDGAVVNEAVKARLTGVGT